MHFYAFGQPFLTTCHTYSPSPTVPYSLIDIRTLVGFSLFPLFFWKYIFSSISLRTYLYASGQPSLITWHPYPFCPSYIIFAYFFCFLFFPYKIDRYLLFSPKMLASCNCLRMHFYAFGQRFVTTYHTYSPSPTVMYSLIDVRMLVAFSFFPLFFSKYIFSSISLRTHLYASGQPSLITWHPYPLCPRVILFLCILVFCSFFPIKTLDFAFYFDFFSQL